MVTVKRLVAGGAVLLLAGCAPKTVPLLPVERLRIAVPVQGEAQWLRGGELRVTTPRFRIEGWNAVVGDPDPLKTKIATSLQRADRVFLVTMNIVYRQKGLLSHRLTWAMAC